MSRFIARVFRPLIEWERRECVRSLREYGERRPLARMAPACAAAACAPACLPARLPLANPHAHRSQA